MPIFEFEKDDKENNDDEKIPTKKRLKKTKTQKRMYQKRTHHPILITMMILIQIVQRTMHLWNLQI